MNTLRPCQYKVGDRVIYGEAQGCNPRWEGCYATVLSVGDYVESRDAYHLYIAFDPDVQCHMQTLSGRLYHIRTLEFRVRPVSDLPDFSVGELL